jgi:hypothetical protein
MKKDAVYSMRMPTQIREALKRAAQKERRTVASLLDKIITDYLAQQGYWSGPEFGAERRRFTRKKIKLPAKTVYGTGTGKKSFYGVLLDISSGGALVTYPKGSDIKLPSNETMPQFQLCLNVPQQGQELCFDCQTRHMRLTADEIQVGARFSNPKEKYLQQLHRYFT